MKKQKPAAKDTTIDIYGGYTKERAASIVALLKDNGVKNVETYTDEPALFEKQYDAYHSVLDDIEHEAMDTFDAAENRKEAVSDLKGMATQIKRLKKMVAKLEAKRALLSQSHSRHDYSKK